MLEITITEVLLFTWAVVATAMWFKHRDEARMARFFVKTLLSDDEMREQVVIDYKRHMAMGGE